MADWIMLYWAGDQLVTLRADRNQDGWLEIFRCNGTPAQQWTTP